VSIDPALASAAPETDVVRALYEGLTELDSRTLEPIPAVAERWEASADKKTWTFHLRKDAKWSNNERVTARDFVRSWRRLKRLGDKTANIYLLQNIVGLTSQDVDELPTGEPDDFLPKTPAAPSPSPNAVNDQPLSAGQLPLPTPPVLPEIPEPPSRVATTQGSGFRAVDDLTIEIKLHVGDPDLPKLLANTLFRPVFGQPADLDLSKVGPQTVTNGAFRIQSIEPGALVLARSSTYWDRDSVSLETVKFVAVPGAEAALEAYKKGDVDVVTNATFEPLAVKLLGPYEDFRRTVHSALNFYQVNIQRPPFSDRRVREALAVAIDRRKLSDADLEGTTEPAFNFSAFRSSAGGERLSFDVERAQDLLARAGFPSGHGFPRVRLIINRNDVQQRVARSVARMWKQHLGVDTEIVVKETSELAVAFESGDFDLIRRGVVMPANNELVSLTSIFGWDLSGASLNTDGQSELPATQEQRSRGPSDLDPTSADAPEAVSPAPTTFDERTALHRVDAIPLYFPVAYALIKPYIHGFEVNSIDAYSLKTVRLDHEWQTRQR
jgi:oligopeptide transport system substrate-binding protein